jgi:phospholipase/carboxylesterase
MLKRLIAIWLLSGLAGVPAAAARPETLLLVKAEKFQKCRLRLPRDYDKEKAYPLLVVLHGNGGDSEGMAALFGDIPQETAIVAVPEGLYARTAEAGGGFSWFYLTAEKALWRELDAVSADFVGEVIDEVRLHFKIDRVYLFGFSQGAALAYLAGLLSPGRFAGIAAIAGNLPEMDTPYALVGSQNLAEGKSLRIFIARGDTDPLVKESVTKQQKDLFEASGYAVDYFEFRGAHVVTRDLIERTLHWMSAPPRPGAPK